MATEPSVENTTEAVAETNPTANVSGVSDGKGGRWLLVIVAAAVIVAGGAVTFVVIKTKKS